MGRARKGAAYDAGRKSRHGKCGRQPGLPEINAPLRHEPRRDDKKVIGPALQFVGEPIFASIKMAPVKTSGDI